MLLNVPAVYFEQGPGSYDFLASELVPPRIHNPLLLLLSFVFFTILLTTNNFNFPLTCQSFSSSSHLGAFVGLSLVTVE
jgi:hypothetical protein